MPASGLKRILRYCSGLNLSSPAGRRLCCGVYGAAARRLASASKVSKVKGYAAGALSGGGVLAARAPVAPMASANSSKELAIETGKAHPKNLAPRGPARICRIGSTRPQPKQRIQPCNLDETGGVCQRALHFAAA